MCGGAVRKKQKLHSSVVSSPADLRRRIERARQEGRFQNALELAKQLHKHEPTPEHLDLLREMYLGRARQLRGQGQTRDALTVLEAALQFDEMNGENLSSFAEECALCGDVRRALALAEKITDAEAAARIRAHAADAAVVRETAGRALLPVGFQADFDRIALAFRQAESGDDDAARATLQGIGLRSPFLEWKLLLRGLQASWNNDDARALENWQRLTPERVPARLAAPFRWQIDAAFRAAQPVATQAALQKQLDRFQGSTLLTQLRSLRATFADKNKLSAAFRQMEALLPTLRQEAPHLLPRLADCFYWAILETGPDDVLRYQRVFGKRQDDANFHRLQAIGYEKGGFLAEANRHWQLYQEEIAEQREKWPGDQADHARAFIWQRMGKNAASVPPRGRRRGTIFDPFDDGDAEKPLKPTAEECFRHSLELAPDLLDTHEALVRHHMENKREAKAEKAARRLLEQFPDRVPTLELLSDLRLKRGGYAEALAFAQKALQGNPLDRRLRRKVSDAHQHHARELVELDCFDQARRELSAALELSEGVDRGIILARWAACEFKAGQPAEAEQRLRQAVEQTPAAVGIAYLILTEVIRLKMDRALKNRFTEEFRLGLAAPPTAAGVGFLTRVLAGLHTGGVVYSGQKGHTQKILAYASKAQGADFSEPQLEELCQNLLDLEAYPRARRFADMGERLYSSSPVFPYLHALGWLQAEGRRVYSYDVVPLLQRAQRLARTRPPDERRDRLLADVENYLRELHPYDFDMLEQLFGGGGQAEEEPDEDTW